MANYYEKARTNYFRVKDLEAFKEWIRKYFGTVETSNDENRKDKVCILWEDGFNEFAYDPDSGDELEGSFFTEISDHLVEGEICVLVASGYEKLRYITGYAQAINSKGEMVGVSIGEIYGLAASKFGVGEKEIDVAEY